MKDRCRCGARIYWAGSIEVPTAPIRVFDVWCCGGHVMNSEQHLCQMVVERDGNRMARLSPQGHAMDGLRDDGERWPERLLPMRPLPESSAVQKSRANRGSYKRKGEGA